MNDEEDLQARATGHSILVHSTPLAAPIPDAPAAERKAGDLTDQLIETDVWTDEMVAAAGIPIKDFAFVSVGGGVGSFTLVDHLRIAGVPVQSIAVLTNIDVPWQTYEYLTRMSQIPRPERLRSDSSGMPDNIWGFPSYALKESRKERTLAPLWSVFSEPIFTDYWTPRAGTVFEALAAESARIGFPETLHKGQVRMIRRRHGGGYFTVLTPPPGTSATHRVAFRSRFVHVAVGYPGLRFLADLQAYRLQYNDSVRVVNAYEPHEHVYEALINRGGTVLVRGGGIVASRILQRLMEDRFNNGANTTIIHLFRTFIDGSHGDSIFSRRKGGDGWAYQGFNWPKGSWGGQVKGRVESLEGDERAALYKKLGGTHTPKRKLWQQQMARARSEGWYNVAQGVVDDVRPTDDNRVVTQISSKDGSHNQLVADFVIDATGLEGDLREHRVLADLLDHGGAARNPLGRLDVERTFEVRGTRSDSGRMYTSGSMALGGYYMGVDSFLGLQFAALAITDDLARQGFCHRIGVGRSLRQWWRWMRHRPVD